MRLLNGVAPRGSSPGLRDIDAMLCTAARRMVREKAAKDAAWGMALLDAALNKARSTGDPPRIDDLELARELARRASAAYGVLGELSEDALHDNVAAQWDNIADAVKRLIASCLNERAKIIQRMHEADDSPVEPSEEPLGVDESASEVSALIEETDRITRMATGVAKGAIAHPVIAGLIGGI